MRDHSGSSQRPDGAQAIIAADHTLPSPNEEFQQVEDLWLDRNKTVTAAQLAPIGIKDKIIEPGEKNQVPLVGATLRPPNVARSIYRKKSRRPGG
jgi:hypothetical protein